MATMKFCESSKSWARVLNVAMKNVQKQFQAPCTLCGCNGSRKSLSTWSLHRLSTDQRLSQFNQPRIQNRLVHYDATNLSRPKKNLIVRLLEKFNMGNAQKKAALERSAVRLYACYTSMVNFEPFFEEMALPDTLNSWFRVTELHMWMIMVRLSQEEDGKLVRNHMLLEMYSDLEERIKKIGKVSVKQRSNGIKHYAEQLHYNLYSYDEGLLDDDRVLAGALWRSFFEMNYPGNNPERMELLVRYVRRQIQHLDQQDSKDIMDGSVTFLPLDPNLNIDQTAAEEKIRRVVGLYP